jgi:phosphoserine phosphatase
MTNEATDINEFSDDLWRTIEKKLESALSLASGGRNTKRTAAFDADGTLWDKDAGETFFDWQIKNSGLPLPKDPFAHYHRLKNPDPRTAYLWLAQISAGQNLDQVRAWAKTCFESHQPWPVFESARRLIELLKKERVEIYIVTASIKWAVEPAALALGIDFNHVLGITTEVRNNIISNVAVNPITWRQGKADALLARTKGVRPILACGNTLGDIALLNSATDIQLAVSTQNQSNELFEEELKLRQRASESGWLQHQYRKI